MCKLLENRERMIECTCDDLAGFDALKLKNKFMTKDVLSVAEVTDRILTENVIFSDSTSNSHYMYARSHIIGTIIIMKRHPTLELAIGPEYPGFYDTLEQASLILEDWVKLWQCHAYLRRYI